VSGIVPKDPRERITPAMWRALRNAYPNGERLAAAWRLARDLDTLGELLSGCSVSSDRLDPEAVFHARRRTLVTLSAPAELLNVAEEGK
jgi:hypothetical protein